MPKITIIGAGQSGLQLAIGLLKQGYDVTVVTDKTPEEVATGRVTSSQCMFGTARQYEIDMGLPLEDQTDLEIRGLSVSVVEDTNPVLRWSSHLDLPAMSIDQRVKMPRWMQEFTQLGGELIIHNATVDDLDVYAQKSDLTIVAAGKGEIARLFIRNEMHSPFSVPQRALALTYITGYQSDASEVDFTKILGAGEYFIFPALTLSGRCHIMVMEGIIGGPMDCWSTIKDSQSHLEQSKNIMQTFLPEQYHRYQDIELTDASGYLSGSFAPIVRNPIAILPSGLPIVGMADVVVLNDPVTGQGSNNASKCAYSYFQSILNHTGSFDADFMQYMFDCYWNYGRYVTEWTNAMLNPTDHMISCLAQAEKNPVLAHRFANGFNEPRDYSLWFLDHNQMESCNTELVTHE